MKKMTENEKTRLEIDLRNLPVLIDILKSKDLRVVDQALKIITVLCENNPKTILMEFD